MRCTRALGSLVLGACLASLVGCGFLLPHTVSTPAVPAGPEAGEASEQLAYSTGGASCRRGHPVEYRFDWNDGTYSAWDSSTQATKTWSDAGTYEVKAQARCAEDQTVISIWSTAKPVTIAEAETAPPVAEFTFEPATPEAGESVTFDASGSAAPDGTIEAYAWDFGDGNTGSGETTTHTYATADTYTVVLAVTDDHGKTGTATQNVTVYAAPEADPTPLAWGYIGLDGSVQEGSPGLACSWNASLSRYEITLPEGSYHFSSYITLGTPIGSDRYLSTGSVGGKLTVYINNLDGTLIQSRFHFVVHETPADAVAWGYITHDGTVSRGSPGLMASWNVDLDRYEITIPGVNYHFSQYLTLMTAIGSGRAAASVAAGGDLTAYITDSVGQAIQSRFHFVVYDVPAEPLAWGYIGLDGAVEDGSPGLVSSWNADLERYEITIPGANYHFSRYIALSTPVGAARCASTGSVGGKLIVYIAQPAGARIQSRFHFVVYEF